MFTRLKRGVFLFFTSKAGIDFFILMLKRILSILFKFIFKFTFSSLSECMQKSENRKESY